MMHIFLLLFGICWGIVICVMLFSFSVKAGKGIWLVTIPGILIVATLAIGFTCHMLHLPHPIVPYQKQILSTIRWISLAAVPLILLMKLFELWSKKRVQKKVPPQT